MPLFKSTYNILTKGDEDEVWNDNWMDSDKLVLPPKRDWTYDREMQIEDVDIWEQLHFETGGIGIYASWSPYAEFYLITTGVDPRYGPKFIDGGIHWDKSWETYYGPGAQQKVFKRAKELGINLQTYKTWVENDKLWLYQPT
jgi:hypothetical protein